MAVLLPTFAPWLDVHFAGRMPQHDHIFIGEVNLDHHHRGQDDKHEKEPPVPEQPALFLTGVVNLPDRDAAPQNAAAVVCPAFPLWQRIDAIWFPVGETRYTVCGLTVPPPDKPPRL